MSLGSKYKKSLTEKWSMRLKTRHPDGDNYDGIVTHIKSEFIVLCEQESFEFDGIQILPKNVIKGYRDNRFESCCNEIIRENGAIKKCRSLRWIDSCETLSQVVTEIAKRNVWPGIEILFNDNTESAFYLGPVTHAADDHFFLRCYDAAGKWEKEYKLSYNEIFRIEIESRYCRHFNSYMRNRKGV